MSTHDLIGGNVYTTPSKRTEKEKGKQTPTSLNQLIKHSKKA